MDTPHQSNDCTQPQVDKSRRLAIGRLGALGMMGTVSAGALFPIGKEDEALAASSVCVVSAQETQGPYPLSIVLDNPNMVRRDITEGKSGIPLTLTLKVVDYDNGCAPLAGAAVYIWHCDASGAYSGYNVTQNGNHEGETFLRGIQLTNAEGKVTFRTIFPGWYTGRYTHIHIQVFAPNTTLSSSGAALATTQLTFPASVIQSVYNVSTLYPNGQNTSVTSWSADQVFGNGIGSELAATSGQISKGLAAGLVIGMSTTTTSPASGDNGAAGGAPGVPPGGTPPSGTPPTGTPPSGPPPSGAAPASTSTATA